jgi:mannose-6-phosphate isomerase-like protein (cupin superfamily)
MNITSEQKPWGSFTTLTKNEPSTVKLLYVTKGEEISLQYHNHREEFWKIISGNPLITIGDSTVTANPDDEFFISQGTNHQISAPEDNCVILEISIGDFDENDITRLSDKYGRN